MRRKRVWPSSGRLSEQQVRSALPRERRRMICDLGAVPGKIIDEFVGGAPSETCVGAVNYGRRRIGGALGAVAAALYGAGDAVASLGANIQEDQQEL